MFEKAKGLFAKEEVYEEDPSEQPPKVDKYGIEGQGKQIDYESYLQYKRDFNDARTLNFSSSELYRKRIRERDAALLDTAFWATTASVTGWWLYRKANESENLRRFLHDLPLADLASTKLKKQFQDNLASGLIAEAIDPRSTAVPTVGHSLHSMLTGLEELSPLQLMKTLQLSSFSSLFVDVIDQGYNEARHIKEGSIRAYEDFYKRMIKTEGGVDITNDDIARGFLLENNKLFKALPGEKEGQWVKGELLLDNARVVNTGVKTGESAVSTNRVFEKFANGYGFDVKRQMVEMEPLAVVGGKTKEGLVGNWIRAYGRFSAELGARSLDNPLGFIEEYANLTGKQGAIFASKPWKLMKKYANVQLGSGGVYNVTTTEMLKRTGKNLAIKGGAIGLGLAFADMAVESIAGESSAWNNGVISGIADTAMKAHIKFAEVWSDNFQGIRSAQENAASGSTNISSLLGITLAGAMAGANVAFFQRMFDNTRMGVDASSVKHLTEVKVGGVIGEVLEKVGQNKATSTLGRYSRVGALFGAVAALPFLPGAIVGKSSQELRDEYSGRTEVGVRDTRLWLCLTADSPVFTVEGLKRADGVSVGDALFNSKGVAGKVQEVHRRWTRERVFEIRTQLSGTLYTKITEDHEVLTQRGWVRARDLEVSDSLVVGVPSLTGEVMYEDLGEGYRYPSGVLKDTINHVQTNRYSGELATYKRVLSRRFLPMTEECGLFLGWFLAEGSIHKRSDSENLSAIEVSFHKTERGFAEERIKFLQEVLGISAKMTISKNQGEGLRLRFGNEPLGQFLRRFLYRDGEKVFPELTNYSREFVRGFLRGMFYGDGCLVGSEGKANMVSIKSANIQHLVEFRRYASVLGAYGSIILDRGSGCYRLQFSVGASYTLSQEGFRKELYTFEGKPPSHGKPAYRYEDGKIFLNISKIDEFLYEGYVYDYTMSDLHEYTPSVFVIHNSGGGAYEGGKIKYHRDNLLRVLATDADTKTLYGDRKTKRELNPILKPFAYLKNPYRFEEMHTHDAPMPVWGMDTSYGSFLGQVFKGTVGQLIKPTVVNPELQALQNALKSEEGAPMFNGKVKVLAKGVKALMRSEGSSGGVSGSGEEPTRYADGLMFDDETYATPEQEKKDVKSMIEDGWMLRKNAPTNEPYFRSFQGAWSGSEEFVGLKGFVGGLTISASGAHPVDQLRPELEISGSTTNASRALQDMALGDAMGCFLPGMPVLTSKGYKPIEDITVKDKVVSLDYRYRKVLDTHKRHYKDIEVLRVYIEGKLLPITCTPDHVFPMLSLKSLELTEKEIGSSSVGDYLFMLDKDSLNRCSIASYLRLKKPVNKSYKLSRITYIERFTYTGWVYDLSVAETPYYTVCNILCHNSGEFLRRLFPQSASSRRNTINPMRNLVAPEWLPSNDTKYYKNFSRGAVFSHNEMGTVLTPGTKGFEALNPELAGTDPNEIPLVYQYKVLQNIASNSPEHIAIKEHLIRNLEELSDKEKDVFFEAYGQDTAREELKKFDEYATGEEKGKMGLFAIHNAIWETFSHKENPLEPLLPFRPMAKFVHKRTAIEDYEKTQMMGPDTGIWTNPVSHFIRPAYNRTIKTINGGYVPEEYAEKNRVDKYFDKLALVKADKNGETYEAGRNITALAYVGVKDAEDMRKFKMAVSDEHRAYVEAFSREKDQGRRQKILEIVPEDIGRIYQSVWKNIDAYDYAIEKGIDPREYIDHLYLQDTAKLQQATKTRLKDVDKERIEAEAFKDVDKGFFQKRKAEKMREAKAVRLRAAVKEAETYLENQTGSLPGDDWVGWDPRLKVDDLKLKTLTVGKEDIHKYGFWSTDLERLERLTVLDDHVKTMPKLEEVKREVRANAIEELRIRNKLREAGFETTRVTSSPSAKQTLTIKDTEEYLDNYYQR